jgi:hypothetical protein
MRTAVAFERNNKVFIHPYAETAQGLRIFSEPVSVVSKSDDQQVAGQVLAALDASEKKVPHPASWKGIVSPLLKAAGVRSFAAFAKGAKCVEIGLEGETLVFTPTTNGGPREGFLHLNDRQIRCSATEVEIVRGIRLAFDACEVT